MNIETGQLRALVSLADDGTFTDAALTLGVSQAAVSRTLGRLEKELGVTLVRRTTRSLDFTDAGVAFLGHARNALSEIAAAAASATGAATRIRLGYAWSALGKHTVPVLKAWNAEHPGTELVMVKHVSRSSGLAEERCDVAVVRNPSADLRAHGLKVGEENRVLAIAKDDPWSRRRTVRLAEIAGRTIIIDRKTGTTVPELWPETKPHFVDTTDVDDWLELIATGRGVGITAKATAEQYPRPGVRYIAIKDAPVIEVWLCSRAGDRPALHLDLARIIRGAYRGGEG